MGNDLACVTGLLLKACPVLKEAMPHAEWLEYLHTARCTAGRPRGRDRDAAARVADCATIEKAVKKAECSSHREKSCLWWE